MEEVPYQRYHLCKHDLNKFSYEVCYVDPSWIFDKISALGCGQMLEDLDLLEMDDKDIENTPEHIRFLREFLQINSFALNYDAKQFYTLLFLFLREKERSVGIEGDACKTWYETVKSPPVACLVPLNLDMSHVGKGPELAMSEVFDSKKYDLVVRLEKCEGFVASLSTEREEICVWDVSK